MTSTIQSVLIISLLFINTIVLAQSPDPKWEQSYGGGRTEQLFDAIPNLNNDITAVGKTKTKSNGGFDILFLQTSNKGQEQKRLPIGRGNHDVASSIIQTWDGGYLIGGYTESYAKGYQGGKDGWIVKTDENGTPIWDKLYGTKKDEEFTTILQAPDGGYYLVGNHDTFAWIIKINSKGEKEWEETYHVKGYNTHVNTAILDQEDNLLLTGYCIPNEKQQLFLMRIRPSGIKAMEMEYPRNIGIQGTAIHLTDSNELVLTGSVYADKYREDILFLKLNEAGDPIGDVQTYGSNESDSGKAIVPQLDGSYWIIGNGRLERGNRTDDIIVAKVDQKGNLLETPPYEYGKKQDDIVATSFRMSDGTVIIAGHDSYKITLEGDAKLLAFDHDKYPKLGSSPTLQMEDLGVYYPNQNGFIEKEQRGYQLLRIKNTSNQDAYALEASLTCPNCVQGIRYAKKLHFGRIAAQQSKLVSIPFVANKSLRNGTSPIKVQFTEMNGGQLPDFQFNVISQRASTPQLLVSSYKFITPQNKLADRNEKITLQLVLRNDGDKKANNVRLKFGYPYHVEELSTKKLIIGDLAPGASKTITFDFKASSVYRGDNVIISLRVQEQSENYGINEEFKLPLKTIEESVVVNEPVVTDIPTQNTDFLDIYWFNPDPDDYENYTIPMDIARVSIQLKAKSSQPLSTQHFTVFVNGKIYNQGKKFGIVKLRASRNIDKITNQPNSHTLTLSDIPLNIGDNEVYVKVKNDAGEATSAKVNFNFSGAKPNLFVFAIGVPQPDLKYTTKDAQDFSAIFSNQQGENRLFNKVQTYIHKDVGNTTKNKIIRKFRQLQIDNENELITEKDVVIVFISSHGYVDESNRFKIQTYDYDPLYTEGTSLDFQKDILKEFRQLECTKFVFVDACRNKANTNVDGGSTKSFDQNDAINKAIIQLLNDNGDIKTMLSCSEGEYSYEHKDWGNGAFTKCMIEATTPKQKNQVDQDQNNILSMAELYEYVRTQVPVLVSKKFTKNDRQNPHIPDEQQTVDLPILVYPN